MGAINQLKKFIPHLATHSSPLRPLNNRNGNFKMEESHKLASDEINTQIRSVAKTVHFDVSKPTCITCDGSHDGLGATLELLDDPTSE